MQIDLIWQSHDWRSLKNNFEKHFNVPLNQAQLSFSFQSGLRSGTAKRTKRGTKTDFVPTTHPLFRARPCSGTKNGHCSVLNGSDRSPAFSSFSPPRGMKTSSISFSLAFFYLFRFIIWLFFSSKDVDKKRAINFSEVSKWYVSKQFVKISIHLSEISLFPGSLFFDCFVGGNETRFPSLSNDFLSFLQVPSPKNMSKWVPCSSLWLNH